MMGPYGPYGGGMGWGDWLGMGLFMLVFWGLVVTGIVLVFRSFGHHHQDVTRDTTAPTSTALHILDERFARGEIDADDYRARRELISSR